MLRSGQRIDVAELAELKFRPTYAPKSFSGGGLVHREVGQAVGFLVELAAHVFERHPPDTSDKGARVLIERLETGILHAVFAAQLLDEQLGIRTDVQRLVPVVQRPRQGGQETVVFRDVVGRVRETAVQLGDHGAVVAHNLHAVPCGTRVAAGAAVDIRRDHAWRERPVVPAPLAAARSRGCAGSYRTGRCRC